MVSSSLVSWRRRARLPGWLAAAFLLAAFDAGAQNWPQWGQNARHTGFSETAAQKPDALLGQFLYDGLAGQLRQDNRGELLVHYMAPLVDGGEVFIMTRGRSEWVSCSTGQAPCGTARWPLMEWGVTKLRLGRGTLEEQWSVMSTWKPAPDPGTGWEPVFHPALSGAFLFVPCGGGTVMKFDRRSGAFLALLQPFPEKDPDRYVTSPLTLDAQGSLYYTVMKLDHAAPWTTDVREAWLVKVDREGVVSKVSFAELVPGAPVDGCTTTFAGSALPWPPASGAKAPASACGRQRPGLNVAPAVDASGTIYLVSRAHFNAAYGYLVAVNADFSVKWNASLRDRLNDGCDVLLPPSGTQGGCRAGSLRGVDPTTNELPAGSVEDQSTASPAIAPDGSILYGAFTAYNYERGHLFHFDASGAYLGAFDFGWDITPAIYEHDGSWSAIVKDNFYPVGSYCAAPVFCGEAEPRYSLISLGPDLQKEWSYGNENDQLCERLADGTLSCQPWTKGFEWCVNMAAVDRDGVVYANSEDGNVYAIDRSGREIGRLFLKSAIGAAYTPLSIGADGRVYAQNDGTLFVVGERGNVPARRDR